MAWNSAVVVGYGLPKPGREKIAMANLEQSLKHLLELAGEGKCAEPIILGRMDGSGTIVTLTESTEASYGLLAETFNERALITAQYSSTDLTVEVVSTGEAFTTMNASYSAIGEELGYL